MPKHGKTSAPPNPLTPKDMSRIVSAVALAHGGGVPKGSYVGDMQRHMATQAKTSSKAIQLNR